MKKDWLYWIGGGSNKSSKRGRFTKEENHTPATPPTGCMCFQIFDLNLFHFPLAQHQQQYSKPDHDSGFLQDEHTIFKGVEAPRNSLELEENMSSNGGVSSISSSMKEQANFNISVAIQIRTSCDSKSPRESTSECSSSSPGTRTPGVVARLMGLDLLPEDGSPSSSRYSTPTMKSRLQQHYSAGNRDKEDRARNLLKSKSRNGTHSLPGTPRVSSSSDRRSDVDQSRLSLQITNRAGDNNGEDDQIHLASYIAKRVVARRREELARSSFQEDGSTSQKRHHAKQIVKQMKESVTRRKFGLDITNSVKDSDEQNVVLLKPYKKSSRENDQSSNNTSKQTTPSCSPKLRFLEIKNHHKPTPVPCSAPPLTNSQTYLPKISSDNKIPQEIKPEVQLVQLPQSHQQPKSLHKVAIERYKKTPPTSGASIIKNKKEEPFVHSPSKNKDNNSRKFPLSNKLLTNNVPTILPVKKDSATSPSSKLFQNQFRELSNAQSSGKSKQLPSSLSQSYYSSCSSTIQERCNTGTKTSPLRGDLDVEKEEYYYFQYIQRILKRTGIHSSTQISLAKWYSPSHPLDPAIFHYIELFHHPNTCKLNLIANRKLIFHLADELLAQILKPYINFKPWIKKSTQICPQMNGHELTKQICSRIEAYPLANCQVLEDIDALLELDFRDSSCSSLHIECAFEEEGEGIVTEIARYIMESLVHETIEEVMLWRLSRRTAGPRPSYLNSRSS